ncbi:hypothetical protein AGABI1DRAFT_109872 [Agaricus bisporus var. burnettii JB137-S8]|uniref:non-specific serine/threonine protein kinase n=1 Tax=Agaricus bisporus var. burnettii (strain JB137-S8 / ATCC MYA-4627 / FGSC 10392) TaxID=597362 RepID=K5VK82_AGABU|nr:uncharacterized protein AGABI1DRAFT_109872 [Agaricus bisporus var. burnettii JB137-S8]EKM74744.1 hypothetical protein AGABI1DRAFT_109872 [Agaricus bisporus var. burnettii JB137-S8]
MDTTEELQQLEITALKSIYEHDFIECPPPKAWKGAARVPEFIIKVRHPDSKHADKINFSLNVRLPKTYPTLACPTFTIQKPVKGLTNEQVTRLSNEITREAQKCRGSEMVFQIVTCAQEWIENNVTPPVEVAGSLALQMNQRAKDEERVRREKAAEALRLEQERQAKEEEELQTQIQVAVQRQQHQQRGFGGRARANSDATDDTIAGSVESPGGGGDYTPIETFDKELEVNGIKFSTVKLFHARPEGLGTTYLADPICDDINASLPLELHTITFDSPYYLTTQGKRKLTGLQEEIKRLMNIRHFNLVSVFAVKLVFHSSAAGVGLGGGGALPPQLMILMERLPGLSLQDVLEDCAVLREERASGYLSQILGALNAIHLRDIVHRGLAPNPDFSTSSPSKVIKLGKVGYHTRLLDLHRSNPFGNANLNAGDDGNYIPDAWLSNDAKNESSLLYTRRRDIHAVGIVFLQMLLGLDVMQRFNDVHDALQNSNISPGLARIALNMLDPPKKSHTTCISLLAELAENSVHAATAMSISPSSSLILQGRGGHLRQQYQQGGFGGGRTISKGRLSGGNVGNAVGGGLLASSTSTIAAMGSPDMGFGSGFGGRDAREGDMAAWRSHLDQTTPVPNPNAPYFGSPELEYFRMPPKTRQASRWKEDWEELELLGRGAFGSVVKARNKIDNRIYAVKKIRLKTQQSDTKIFREVNALSRLSHRFIVRYFTTWVETSESNMNSCAGGGGDSGGLLSAGTGSNDSGSDGEGIFRSPSSRSRWLRIPGFRSSSSSSPTGKRTAGSDSEEDEEESRNSASTVSERHLPTNGGGFSLSEFDESEDFDFRRHHHSLHLGFGDDDDSVATTTTTEISGSRGSFPSIHFDGSGSGGESSTEEEETDEGISSGSGSGSPGSDGIQFGTVRKGHGVAPARATASTTVLSGTRQRRPRAGTVVGQGRHNNGAGKTIHPKTPDAGVGGRTEVPPYALASTRPPNVTRTLYIQMEFVERQTLRERIDDGITEDEAWRLFGQIVDALVHMSNLGILHRDIKLTNIFIDAKGDCKVGDFGLATSSLAAVDPSDVTRPTVYQEADLTLEVGTRLYIAPEVQSRKKGPRNHSKADMYSLGIVFFEMNYMFSTGSERIAVIEDLRKSEIFFPATWDVLRSRQKKIITWLLQHDTNDRPTALELSESPLMPPRLEDENFKDALNLMAKHDSPYHQAVISSLFTQQPKISRSFLYDSQSDPPEHATALNSTVQEHLVAIFRLHGAVDMEPPLLMPMMDQEDQKSHATFIDRQGDVVGLPSNLILPFARMAARMGIKRIKRYHITNAYRPSPVAGHPKSMKAAVFDIVTHDLVSGPIAAGAEIVSVINDVLNCFPNLALSYDIHVSHSNIVELVMGRIPDTHRHAVVDIINQTKSSPSQKRASLLRKGLLRSTTDELEILSEVDSDIDNVLSRLEKISSPLATLIRPAVAEIQNTLRFAASAGLSRQVFFHPLMLGSHQSLFKDGVIFEVVKRNKRMDVLAAGGRYDNLIARFSPSKQKLDAVCAMGFQIAVEKITAALAMFQSTSVKTLVKEERSFGFWSPRRCDVYVMSYHAGHLQDRLEVVSYLWQHSISADIMYETGLPNGEHESHMDLCAREGILFAVYPRPRNARRDQAAFKVKSVLKGTEYELSRQELVGWLQHQIAEQKRADLATSAAPSIPEVGASGSLTSKDVSISPDIQLVLPVDAKKQRKQVKQLFLDRAFDTAMDIRSSMQNGMPTVAVDVSTDLFDLMVKNANWVTDEEAWKPLAAAFATQTPAYANQIREAVAKRKAEGHRYVLLFAVKEDKVQLLDLS